MRQKNDITIGMALDNMISDLKLKPKLNEARIQQRWPELMGGPIAKYTTNIYIKGRKLYIQISSSTLKQELMYSREKIKVMMNTEIGDEALDEVVIF